MSLFWWLHPLNPHHYLLVTISIFWVVRNNVSPSAGFKQRAKRSWITETNSGCTTLQGVALRCQRAIRGKFQQVLNQKTNKRISSWREKSAGALMSADGSECNPAASFVVTPFGRMEK